MVKLLMIVLKTTVGCKPVAVVRPLIEVVQLVVAKVAVGSWQGVQLARLFFWPIPRSAAEVWLHSPGPVAEPLLPPHHQDIDVKPNSSKRKRISLEIITGLID